MPQGMDIGDIFLVTTKAVLPASREAAKQSAMQRRIFYHEENDQI